MQSRVTYTVNNTNTFNYPYPFVSQSHLQVRVNGVLKTLTTHYTITSGAPVNGQPTVNISFTTGNVPANGAVVQIIRRTGGSSLAPFVSFNDGQVLKQSDLENDSRQAFYLCQEALDDFENTLQFTYDNKLSAGGREITDVGTPTDTTSAVTVSYLESYALGNATNVYVQQAQAAAATATTQAGNASTSASNASTSASNASTSASNASTSASNAGTSASNASTSATNAQNALAAMDQGINFPDVPNGSDYDSTLTTGDVWQKQEFYTATSSDGLVIQTRRVYTAATTGSPVDYDLTLNTPLTHDVYGIFITPWNDVAVDFKITQLYINGTWVATNSLTGTFVSPELSSGNQLTAIRVKKPASSVATVFSIMVIGR